MANHPFKYPVPENPPDAGDFLIIGFNPEWLPVVLAKLQELRSPTAWEDPPDNITGQVDELIYLMQFDLDP